MATTESGGAPAPPPAGGTPLPAGGERGFATVSGRGVRPVYTADDLEPIDLERDLPPPGTFPYTGLRQTPEQIVSAALQEDADVIGLSILSGAHNHICPRVVELLRERGVPDVLVVVGGIIPDHDVPALEALGIKGIFRPGSPMHAIVRFIEGHVRDRE